MNVLIVQGYVPHYRIPVFNALENRDNDVAVTVLHSGEPARPRGATFSELCVPLRHFGPLKHQPGIAAISRGFDVVIGMLDIRWLSSWTLRLAKDSPGVIWWGHGFGRKAVANRVRVHWMKTADAVLLYDEAARREVIASGCPAEKVFVAPNTIHMSNAGINPTGVRTDFLYVGRLQQRKKIELLIYAFAHARDRLPPWTRVVVVGEGSIRARLERLASRLGLEERVRFLGAITSDVELKPIFHRALAYVSPGHVGLGVLHSFAYGIPVITRCDVHQGPEASNIRDGENGLLYEGGAIELARKLADLGERPEESVRLGRNGYKHFTENRSVQNMLAGFEEAIEHVLKQRRA